MTGADHGYDGSDDEKARETYALIARQVRAAVHREATDVAGRAPSGRRHPVRWSVQEVGVGGTRPNFSAFSVSSRHTFGATGIPRSARSTATAALRSPG